FGRARLRPRPLRACGVWRESRHSGGETLHGIMALRMRAVKQSDRRVSERNAPHPVHAERWEWRARTTSAALDGRSIGDLEVLDDDAAHAGDARCRVFRLVLRLRVWHDSAQINQPMLAEHSDIVQPLRGERLLDL